MEQASDTFGEFKFEPLEGLGETYLLQVINAHDAVIFETEHALSGSAYVGVIEVA
jgi:hypothetical protein